jgi:serine/threonine protein kinase
LDRKKFSLVAEFLKGGELLTKKNNFDQNIIREIMRQILAAMSYCHQKKLVHR